MLVNAFLGKASIWKTSSPGFEGFTFRKFPSKHFYERDEPPSSHVKLTGKE